MNSRDRSYPYILDTLVKLKRGSAAGIPITKVLDAKIEEERGAGDLSHA
jgi:hypothetical protein